jgi:hypothetical protein
VAKIYVESSEDKMLTYYGKPIPVHTMEVHGGVEVSFHSFLTSTLDEVMELASGPLAFCPWGKGPKVDLKFFREKKLSSQNGNL